MEDSTLERWYSIEEITEYLRISKYTVYRWIEKRGMPAYKIGGCWKFKLSEIEEWIKQTNR